MFFVQTTTLETVECSLKTEIVKYFTAFYFKSRSGFLRSDTF